jgi:hypothetical protein
MALIDHLDSKDEIRRLGDAAAARMRQPLRARALQRLIALGDGDACIELAFLLIRRDDFDAAESVLVDGARGQRDTRTATALVEVMTLRERAEPLRTNDRAAQGFLWDLLYDRGESLDLRTKDSRGDLTAGDDLAALLAERGELTELRERADAGHRLAGDLLAELLATLRRPNELAARAKKGDQAAATWLEQLTDAEAVDSAAEIAKLRDDLAAGEANAADRLTSLLFSLGDEAELRAEVDAGTPHAVDRLLALLMVGCDDDTTATENVRRLRAFGMHCDGTLALTEGNHHG